MQVNTLNAPATKTQPAASDELPSLKLPAVTWPTALQPPPDWLVQWRIEEPLFRARGEVGAVVAAAKEALKPADPRLISLWLDKIMQFPWAKGGPAEWGPETSVVTINEYLRQFADVPLDLVDIAFDRLLRMTNGFFPAPGQVRRLIESDLHERRRILAKAQRAVRVAREPAEERPAATELAKTEVDAITKQAIAALQQREKEARTEAPPVLPAAEALRARFGRSPDVTLMQNVAAVLAGLPDGGGDDCRRFTAIVAQLAAEYQPRQVAVAAEEVGRRMGNVVPPSKGRGEKRLKRELRLLALQRAHP